MSEDSVRTHDYSGEVKLRVPEYTQPVRDNVSIINIYGYIRPKY